MSIASYPRTIQTGQIAANGNANSGTGLMLYDSVSGTYIAATPATFGGVAAGGATAANQASQIAIENTLSTRALQTSQAAALAASTLGGVLIDTFYTQNLTTGSTPLVGVACKSVTLINLSTNSKFTYFILGSVGVLTLEAGYSVKINTTNSSNIQIAQPTGEAQVCQIIVTS